MVKQCMHITINPDKIKGQELNFTLVARKKDNSVKVLSFSAAEGDVTLVLGVKIVQFNEMSFIKSGIRI